MGEQKDRRETVSRRVMLTGAALGLGAATTGDGHHPRRGAGIMDCGPPRFRLGAPRWRGLKIRRSSQSERRRVARPANGNELPGFRSMPL